MNIRALSFNNNYGENGLNQNQNQIKFGQNSATEIDSKNLYRITKSGLSIIDGIFMGLAKSDKNSMEQKYMTLQKSADIFTKMRDRIENHINSNVLNPDKDEFKRATHASIKLERAERYYEGIDNDGLQNILKKNPMLQEVTEYIVGNLQILSRRLANYREAIRH